MFKCSLKISSNMGEIEVHDWKKAAEKIGEDGIQRTDWGIYFRQKEIQLFVIGWKVKRLLQVHIRSSLAKGSF